MKQEHAFETLAIHAGQAPDPATGAVMTPVYLTSTYAQVGVGKTRGYEYSRTGNPTRKALEDCLAALEGGQEGIAFASGMAALDAIIHLLSPGDHVLAVSDIYGGTFRLFQRVYAQYGLSFAYASPSDPELFMASAQPETRLILLESPTNPLLNLADIQAIASLARSLPRPPWICVDNTFATPYLQQPLSLGADMVMHSTTKYLGGHSDVVGGAIVATDVQLVERLRFLQNAVGAVPGPLDAFLVLRGLKTLAIRMDRHAANAQRIAEHLEAHPAVDRVYYPGLPSHPQFELCQRQMRNPGGMVSFVLRAGPAAARRFAEATRIFLLGESLGGVESLVEIPAAMTHLSTAGSALEIDPGLVRLSVGLEAASDLIADIDWALEAAE
ncbi:MAG TPA: cystathionine gamma-synthase [Anaerolineales bacterium]|nr:cystathionine gamma-synthase [Anaerolineales bacterium]